MIITIRILGHLFEQCFYEINDENRSIIQDWISLRKSKYDIDKEASGFRLIDTHRSFDCSNTKLEVISDGVLLTPEPYTISEDAFYNLAYASIDASTYNDPIIINSSSRAYTSNPELWLRDTQRVYDIDHEEHFMSALNSLMLKGVKDNHFQDKEYLIKTTTYFAVYQYEFSMAKEFDYDKLDLLLDPHNNFYTYTDNIIPDFVLYNQIYCGGKESFSTILKWDWATGVVRSSADVIAQHEFPSGKETREDSLECNTYTTVLF
jgi:hypothetical protein